MSCECKLRLRLGESVGTQSRRRCDRGEPSRGADVAGVSPVPGSGADVAAVRRGEAYNPSSRRANACNRHTPCGTPCRVEYHAVWDTMPYGIPCCMGYHAVWDTMPYGIPCRAGYHAVRDTMPCGIPCCMGYHAVWDTMPYGIPCRMGYHAVWDTMLYGIPCSGDGRHNAQCDATAVPRPDVRGWARTNGRRPSADRISYSVASRTCEWRALNEGATD